MIVILKKDVKGTGKAGDVVKVSDGFARNMLMPKGIAVEATNKNVRTIEKEKALRAEKIANEKKAAEKRAEEMASEKLVIQSKGGDNGKLFGSITSMDIAKAFKEQMNLDIDKKKILLAKPIKTAGSFKVEVKLYTEISAEIEVEILG